MEIISSPVFVFLVSTVAVLLLFWVGGGVGVKGRKTLGKLASYACGEDLPAVKLQVNVEQLFTYALFFLILDALAFLLALSFTQPGIYPILYSIIVLLAVIIAIPMKWF